jgi:myo-inositol-1(or 4)-monophosphatase
MGAAAQEVADELRTTNAGTELLGQGAGGDITTRFDKEIEDAVLTLVPDGISVMSEESGLSGDGGPVLVIDPLDGSHNAGRGIPNYSISIALADLPLTFGNVTAGYVRHLVTGVEWYCERGRGVLRDGIPVTASKGLHTVGTELYTAAPPCMERAIVPLQLATKVRCIGSVALDLAYVADGTFNAFLDLRGIGRTFDVAAGYLMVCEAGGVVSDGNGSPLDGIGIGFDVRSDIIAAGSRDALDDLVAALK